MKNWIPILIMLATLPFEIIYSQNTFPGSGNVGIGTISPKAKLDVGGYLPAGSLSTVMGRLPEGDNNGDGTFLGIRNYYSQGDYNIGIKSFAIEHSFYGSVNNSINFYRGGGMLGGFMTFNTSDNSEKMRITTDGKVGIGTTSPSEKLDINGNIKTNGKILIGSNMEASTGIGSFIKFGNGGWNDPHLKIEHWNNMHAYISFKENLYFRASNGSSQCPLVLDFDGNVGIGMNVAYTAGARHTQGYKLAVNGGILCESVKVIGDVPASDYVFDDNYELPSLNELEQFVKKYKHLPEVPTAKEFKENGYNLGEMDNLLLKKVEQLTLYIIEQQKAIEELKDKVNQLQK